MIVQYSITMIKILHGLRDIQNDKEKQSKGKINKEKMKERIYYEQNVYVGEKEQENVQNITMK